MKLNRDQKIEITHDILAKQVYARIGAEDKMRLKIAQFIRDRHDYYLQEGVLLGAKELNYIDPYLDRIETTEQQNAFIRESRHGVKKSARRRRLIIAAIIALLSLFSIFALVLWQNAETAKDQARNSEELTKQANLDLDLQRQEALKARDEARQNKLKADTLAQEAKDSARSAQQQRLLALRQQQKAESAEQETRSALNALEQSNSRAVLLLLQDAKTHIMRLQHDDALLKLATANTLRANPKVVANVQLELAFWYTESGLIGDATNVLFQVFELLDKEVPSSLSAPELPTLEQLRQAIESLDLQRYAFFQERYFPLMVPVRGGTFSMGCNPELDENCKEDEGPQHTVTLGNYRIAKTEITFWQFGLFCAATGRNMENYAPAWGFQGDNPAVNISWFDAIAYAQWLNEYLGLKAVYPLADVPTDPIQLEAESIDWANLPNWEANGYRLPTEAEWEYAARGGHLQQDFIYSGGNTQQTVAWYKDQESGSRSHAVATKQPNALGLYDLSGNVDEWCWDRYDADYYENSPADQPKGPDAGDMFVLRGGSWYSYDFNCRVSSRLLGVPNNRYDYYGFRLVRSGMED